MRLEDMGFYTLSDKRAFEKDVVRQATHSWRPKGSPAKPSK